MRFDYFKSSLKNMLTSDIDRNGMLDFFEARVPSDTMRDWMAIISFFDVESLVAFLEIPGELQARGVDFLLHIRRKGMAIPA